MKNKLLVFSLLGLSILAFARPAHACALACAAICRYTCQGTPQAETGCGDMDYANSLQRCCEEAFRTTPGIDHVACTEGGGGGY
jgi:hypothetical protein